MAVFAIIVYNQVVERIENRRGIIVAETENRNTHKVYEKDKIGEVQIADEVVAIIAGLAATEVDGVDSMAGNITNELVGKLGMKEFIQGRKGRSNGRARICRLILKHQVRLQHSGSL